MIKAAVFGGTTEGRLIAGLLSQCGYEAVLFVATELGEDIAKEKEKDLKIHTGRLNENEIEKVLINENFGLVIDSTHPYAVEVTENIKKACQNLNIRLLRLIREDEFFSDVTYVDKTEDLLDMEFKGNILFTTGSKETGKLKSLKKDIHHFIRVLPTEASVNMAKEQGFLRENIITGQGPFSLEDNVKLIKEKNIKYLITKDSGKTGGLDEKIQAARECNIKAVIIKKPKEDGLTLKEMSELIKKGNL